MIIRTTRKGPVVILGYILAVAGLVFFPEIIALAIGLIIGASLDVELEGRSD